MVYACLWGGGGGGGGGCWVVIMEGGTQGISLAVAVVVFIECLYRGKDGGREGACI